MPSWQPLSAVQTWASAEPSSTPHPQALTNSPQAVNSWMRLLSPSATKIWPLEGSVARPRGRTHSPASEPKVQNLVKVGGGSAEAAAGSAVHNRHSIRVASSPAAVRSIDLLAPGFPMYSPTSLMFSPVDRLNCGNDPQIPG